MTRFPLAGTRICRMSTRAVVALLTAALLSTGASRQAPGIVAKDATVLGFKLHYVEAGRGPTVVLLHGIGGSGARWRPNVEALSAGFHVVALDQIGFGDSDKPLANYHAGMLAEFLVDFLKAIGSPKAIVIGNSMGGNVALYTAVHYPEAVSRLVLVDGGVFRAANAPPAPPQDPHRRQITNGVTRDETREYFRLLFHDDSLVTDQMVDESLAMRLRSAYSIARMLEAGEKGLGSVSEDEVRRLKVPTLVVWGRDDELINVATADRLEQAIAGSKKVIIDNAGHMPQLERPADFNRIVREFLTARGVTE